MNSFFRLIHIIDQFPFKIDDHSDYGSTFSKSPGVLSNYVAPNAFTFPVAREPLTHKAAVYYHQQLALQEDQGIDLTQSPGRDSPGSSSGSAGSGSRHSTASLDSGRASSYHTQTSSSTRGALSSPRCSVSSCSIGSVDRMTSRTVRMTVGREKKFPSLATESIPGS